MDVPKVATMRLVIQASIPFEDFLVAETCYNALKGQFHSMNSNCTVNGQIIKMLEPCCGDKIKNPLSPGMVLPPPGGVR